MGAIRDILPVVVGCLGVSLLSGCDQPVRPTRPAPQSTVAVTASAIKLALAPGKFEYTFNIRLQESGGVAGSVKTVNIEFDNGFGASCSFTPANFGQDRLSASGTLELNPLKCSYPDGYPAVNAYISASVHDDNGYTVNAGVVIPSL